MYAFVLFLHSLTRWIVLLLVAGGAIKAAAGAATGAPYVPADRKLGLAATIALDVNFLLGLVLYLGLSPIVRTAWSDMGAAMKDGALRFFAVEHFVLMLLAVVAAHVGTGLAKKAADDTGRHKRVALGLTVALLLIVLGIPWPFREVARPWLTMP